MRTGKVFLVGAGPGDPGLLTLRGHECLRRADAVLYDYLANPRLLEHAPAHAIRECLGRHGRSRLWRQDEINERMIELARQGLQVVRLKGGDPAIFGRLAEERDALNREGILYEIVPGVTTASAAAACVEIPITHRDRASAVAFIAGQERPGKHESALDYRTLAKFPGTLVYYMGVTTSRSWSKALIDAGMARETPAVIVRRCSLADQLTIRCTLGEVADTLDPENAAIRPPVIVVVGDVAGKVPSHSWFEQRALFGRSILVTRPGHQAAQLSEPLAELGADVLIQPAIEITEPSDWGPVDASIDRLDEFDWIVFSSGNGVRFFLDRLFASGHDARRLAPVRLAAIGPGTASELQRYHLNADVVPAEFRAEALAESLAGNASRASFLLVRASRGREVLAEQLQAAGGHVEQVVAYRSQDVATPSEEVAARMNTGQLDCVTVTSSAIARSLARLYGDGLKQTRLASISPVTSSTLRELGHEPWFEASEYTMPGLINSLLDLPWEK